MSLVRYTASGLTAYALPLAAALVSVPFYLHVLGPPRYGTFILLLALTNYACFFDLGFGKASAYFLAHLEPDVTNPIPRRFYASGLAFCGGVSSLIAIIGILAAPWLADLLPRIDGASHGEMLWGVIFSCATIPAMALVTFLTGVYQGLHKFYRLSAVLAGGGIFLQIMPLLICLLIDARLDVALATVFLVRSVTVLVLIVALRPTLPWRVADAFARGPLRELITFGRWPAILSLLGTVLNTGDRVVISGVVGPVALAAYSVPFDLTNRLMIVSGSVANTIFPLLARDEGGTAGRIRRTREALLGLFTPIVVVGILTMYPFLRAWVGHAIADQSRMVGEIIICGVWMTAMATLSQSRLLAEKRGRAIATSYAAQIPPFLIGIYWCGGHFGLVGCAVVWSLRCLADAIIMIWLAHDGEGVTKPLISHGSVLMFAIVVSAASTELIPRLIALAILLPISLLVSRRQIALVVVRFLNL